MSPGECVSPSSQKKRFILGVFSRWRDAVGAVASLGCVYSVSHRRIMLLLLPREGGGGRCCCCCWDWDCREGEDEADGVGAVERKERECARAREILSARCTTPTWRSGELPRTHVKGLRDAAIRWRWRAFPRRRCSLNAMTGNQVEMPLRSVRMCPACGIVPLPSLKRSGEFCFSKYITRSFGALLNGSYG